MLHPAERAVHGTPLLPNNQRSCTGILSDLPLTPLLPLLPIEGRSGTAISQRLVQIHSAGMHALQYARA